MEASFPIKLSDFTRHTKLPSELLIIAGPCVLETPELAYKIAAEMTHNCRELGMHYVFKASYDKANRTSCNSYRGLGIKEGLRILADLKRDLGVYITSDVHSPQEAEQAGEVLDIIQIPAFLCRQTDIVVAAAQTGRVVNIKKGQFLSPREVLHLANKVKATGNPNVFITERGTTFGYNNLVVDMRSIQIIQEELGLPVIFDATHSVQTPGSGEGVTGGDSKYAPGLAFAAIAAGAFGLFMEVHPDPLKSPSDGLNMIPLHRTRNILSRCKAIRQACLMNPLV